MLRGFNEFSNHHCDLKLVLLPFQPLQPFSISSAPHEPLITFHVRAVGNWTKQLRDLTISKGNKDTEATKGDAVEATSEDGAKVIKAKINLNIEGPYGFPSIDLTSGAYTVFLLIGGGIGEQLV